MSLFFLTVGFPVIRTALSAAALALLLIVLSAGIFTAAAHKPSDSYLTLTVAGDRVDGRWDIALRDLEQAIGLDRDDDGVLTWGEVRTRRAAIFGTALPALTMTAAGGACDLAPGDLLIADHSDGAYAVLRFTARCPGMIDDLALTYRLLFDLDAQHRGLVRVDRGGAVATGLFTTEQRQWVAAAGDQTWWRQLRRYAAAGVGHIWGGLDHLLFLIALLLPAVVHRAGGRWLAVRDPGPCLVEVAKVVTAFTAAHSATLALATFGLIHVPPRIVVPLIALTIVATALNNLRPVVTRRLWVVAFGFGLVHGIGFSSALVDLGLSSRDLVIPLIGFNFGVEAGQAAVVAVILPLAYVARRTDHYRRYALAGGSMAIAGIGTLWMVEAALAVALMV